MSWIAGKLLSGFSIFTELARGWLRWLLSDFRHIVITALAILAVWLVWQWNGAKDQRDRWQESSAKWQKASTAWQAAHATLLADVQRERELALADDIANAARVQREQTEIIERTADEYEARLADSRAAAARVQRQLETATLADSDHSDGGGTDLPDPHAARCRAFGASDCDAFFTALPAKLTAAEENTAKLISLQDYVRSTLLIDWGSIDPRSADGSEADVPQPQD